MNTAASAHPSPEQLAAFVVGRLDEGQSSALEVHLAHCSACRELAEALPEDRFIAKLRAAAPRKDTVPWKEGEPEPAAVGALGGAAANAETPADLVNHPRYRVLEPLGAGGMGAVYQAEHLLMQRPVALKVLSRKLTRSPEAVARFRREVRAAARLAHPNIVTAYDAEQAGETHFLVMEYVEGIDLARLVAERGPLPVAQACDAVRQAALGLQHAHERGMVHRDIKPSNLMRTPTGQVKILDFGLARLALGQAEAEAPGWTAADTPVGILPGEATPPDVTEPGRVMGTPDYIAPEQAADAHAADIRADIYSLGCTLYYLLAAAVPFACGTAQGKLRAHTEDDPQPLADLRADVPPELLRVLDQMIARDPTQRYATPAQVADALAPFAGPAPAPAQPPRRRWHTTAAVLLLGVLIPAAYVFAPVVYRIVTDQGQVVVEVGDPQIEVALNQAEVTVHDRATDRRYALRPGSQDLRAGDYQIEVTEAAGGLHFSTRELTIRRGGKTVLQVTLEPPAAADPGSLPPSLVNSIGMKLTLIPAGEFDMGSTPEETAWALEEGRKRPEWHMYFVYCRSLPRHRVRISRPFYMGVYEVTQAEYQQVMGANPSSYAAVGGLDTSRHPVEMVLWEEAVAFCTRLAALPGERAARRSYRLPTEAEWEYACRAGTATRWSCGDDERALGEYAWFLANAQGRTHPVGQKKPNAWGLYDMHGNVWELCADWFGTHYYCISPPVDPPGASTGAGTAFGEEHVIRGAAWGHPAFWCRAAWRLPGGAIRTPDLGFRVVCEAGGSKAAPGAIQGAAGVPGADQPGRVLPGVAEVRRFLGRSTGPIAVALSADGRRLLSGTPDQALRVWDVETGQEVRRLTAHGQVIWWVAISPDGRRALSTGGDGTVRLWDLETGKQRLCLRGHAGCAHITTISRDGRRALSGGDDGTLRLWDLEQGRELRCIKDSSGQVFGVAMSADGRCALSGCNDGTVHLWDLESGQELRRFAGHPERVTAVAFVLGGRQVASTSGDGTLRLWDLETGKELRCLLGHTEPVRRMAIAADGRRAVSVGWDNTVRVWDLATGQEVFCLLGHKRGEMDVTISADGRSVVSSSNDGTIRLWRLPDPPAPAGAAGP
jgi:formylglycine-generating enzyme required for sulfatase activity/tRNA A-37 threonylcarbamoyl transferase component Bud32